MTKESMNILVADVANRVMEKIAGNALAKNMATKVQQGGSQALNSTMNQMTPDYAKPGPIERIRTGNFGSGPVNLTQSTIRHGLEGMANNHTNGQNMAKEIASARKAGDINKVEGLKQQARENGQANRNYGYKSQAGVDVASPRETSLNNTIQSRVPAIDRYSNLAAIEAQEHPIANAVKGVAGGSANQVFNKRPEAIKNALSTRGAGSTIDAINQVNIQSKDAFGFSGEAGSEPGYIKKLQDTKRDRMISSPVAEHTNPVYANAKTQLW